MPQPTKAWKVSFAVSPLKGGPSGQTESVGMEGILFREQDGAEDSILVTRDKGRLYATLISGAILEDTSFLKQELPVPEELYKTALEVAGKQMPLEPLSPEIEALIP